MFSKGVLYGAMSAPNRPSGHLQIKGPNGARRWHAFWTDAEGKHQRVLGPAHVRDSGKRTSRGAIVWRAGHGPKPTLEHLTPDDANGALRELLAGAPKGTVRIAGRHT